jgi:peptidoglycan hydrolase-like protein with peptidoglycan-binding domain
LSYPKHVSSRHRALAAVVFAVSMLATSPALARPMRLGSRVLQKGMAGPDVRTLQHDLTLAGVWTFPSGVFSEGTKIHVKIFQSRHHLGADGVVGSGTVQVLLSIVRKASHGSASRTTSWSNRQAHHRASTGPRSNRETASTASGGSSMTPPPSDAPVQDATLNSQGLAVAASGTPQVIQEVIAAANKIAFKPYVYGGGHASFNSSGYDCSGSVSYALHGGGLLSSPFDSTQFESYGSKGPGRWITIYANGGHVYMNVAGLWFDTAGQSSRNNNDRWTATRISPASGFVVRHPTGW